MGVVRSSSANILAVAPTPTALIPLLPPPTPIGTFDDRLRLILTFDLPGNCLFTRSQAVTPSVSLALLSYIS